MPQQHKSRPPKSRQPKRGLPSEQEILAYLASQPQAQGKRDLARALGVKGQDKTALKKLLRDLENGGKLSRNRKRLVSSSDAPSTVLVDVIGVDADGDLYGEPVEWNDGDAPRVLVTWRQSRSEDTRPPKPGDRILATLEPADDETYPFRARLLRTYSTQAPRTLGIYRADRGHGARILSIDKKQRHDYQPVPERGDPPHDGELVAIEVSRGRQRGLQIARIVQRLGNADDPRNISLLAIHQHGVPSVFPDRVLKEAESLAPFSQQGREDFRKLDLITIDPRDARDHDDAVWAKPDDDPNNPGGHVVVVAIADVAAYVRPGTALDREARIRGNSTYFPDRVVPMLPERISNDLCSLKERQDRPALACVMTFDAGGHKRAHKFHRVIMRSPASLSYEQAQEAIDGRPDEKTAALLEPVLKPVWAAYACLSKARHVRSPLELDLAERKIELDAEGRILRVVVPERLDAHKLIEEFMIQANVAAAEELESRKSPLLYRVHEEPAAEKIRALGEFLRTIGKDFSLGQVLHTRQFNKLLQSVKGEEFERVVHEIVLRTQAQAIYSSKNAGHFGLSLRRYAHFTSPIRRYADLIVHRALISACRLGPDGLSPDDIANLDETAEMISAAERRSMMAERDTIDRLVASLLAGAVGATFKGRISGVVGAGLFVRLNDTGADGFVPAASLGQDYYVFDDVRHALIGKATHEMFQLGDTVEVRLLEATPVKGGLRFEIVSDGRKGPHPARAPKTKGRLAKGKRRAR